MLTNYFEAVVILGLGGLLCCKDDVKLSNDQNWRTQSMYIRCAARDFKVQGSKCHIYVSADLVKGVFGHSSIFYAIKI